MAGGLLRCGPGLVPAEQDQQGGGGKDGHHGADQSDWAGVGGYEHRQATRDADETGQLSEGVVSDHHDREEEGADGSENAAVEDVPPL